jgi:hypothetical protein
VNEHERRNVGPRLNGHHPPDHLRTAAYFIGYRPREKLVISIGRKATGLLMHEADPVHGLGGSRTCNQIVMSIPTKQAQSFSVGSAGIHFIGLPRSRPRHLTFELFTLAPEEGGPPAHRSVAR